MAHITQFGTDVKVEELGAWDGAMHYRLTFPPMYFNFSGLLPTLTLPGHDEALTLNERLVLLCRINRRRLEEVIDPRVLDKIDERIERFVLFGE